jgi:hypothetical protein
VGHPEALVCHAIRQGFYWVAGVLLSCCGVIIFVSTFIPRNSFNINPRPDQLDLETEAANQAKDAKDAKQEHKHEYTAGVRQ